MPSVRYYKIFIVLFYNVAVWLMINKMLRILVSVGRFLNPEHLRFE